MPLTPLVLAPLPNAWPDRLIRNSSIHQSRQDKYFLDRSTFLKHGLPRVIIDLCHEKHR